MNWLNHMFDLRKVLHLGACNGQILFYPLHISKTTHAHVQAVSHILLAANWVWKQSIALGNAVWQQDLENKKHNTRVFMDISIIDYLYGFLRRITLLLATRFGQMFGHKRTIGIREANNARTSWRFLNLWESDIFSCLMSTLSIATFKIPPRISLDRWSLELAILVLHKDPNAYFQVLGAKRSLKA